MQAFNLSFKSGNLITNLKGVFINLGLVIDAETKLSLLKLFIQPFYG